MPFNIHHHSSSASGQPNIEPNQYTATNALFQASQTLGSVGAPSSHSRDAGLTSAGTDGFLLSSGDTAGVDGSNAMNSAYAASSASAPITPANRQSAQFQAPQRAPTFGRQPEELHMSDSGNAMEAHHYQTSPHYHPGEGMSIHLQPSTPQYHNASAGTNVPGALQPGSLSRPTTLSSNTAPGSIPTLPQLSTQMQQPSQQTRSGTLNHTHSYSRSSPAGMDQPKYKPFTNTPESNKFGSPNPSSYVSQMSQGASYSPLGLADIRPRADTGFSDGPMSPTVFSDLDTPQYPTNSNYLTPWPIYAVDWCKWPPKQNSMQAGKIALGSYLEDNHNYVGNLQNGSCLKLMFDVDSDTGCPTSTARP
jgi:DDB1- and CUL4-associated factor 7